MKRYQIVEVAGQFNHAGSKATADVAEIAEKACFEPLYLRMYTTGDTKIAKVKRQIGYIKDWKKIVSSVEEYSIVLLQHPFHYPQLTRENSLRELKEKKHVKFISIIHDVEKLRGFRYNDYYKKEFEFMRSIADIYIVHNTVMKKYFIDLGIPEKQIIVLGIFDYLLPKRENRKGPIFARTLSVAGNLDTQKCGYIAQLRKLKKIQINLYGSNYNKNLDACQNIKYFGSFSPNEIPQQLSTGFGLVWDGSSIEGCEGESGQYLKYNNPHKLSLYLASGLPVVIWKDAAEAEFVKEHHVGICAENLLGAEKQIMELTADKYDEIVLNVMKVSSDLSHGKYMEHALNCAVNKLIK